MISSTRERSASSSRTVVMAGRRAALLVFTLCGSCASPAAHLDPPPPPAPVVIKQLLPGVILPQTVIAVLGTNLAATATHTLILAGKKKGSGDREIVLKRSLRSVSVQRAELVADGAMITATGEGVFRGTARIVSRNDHGDVSSKPLTIELEFRRHLSPGVVSVGDGVVFLNTRVKLEGTSLLLNGAEGRTVADLTGCFAGTGSGLTCPGSGKPINTRVLLKPQSEGDRRWATFEFAPSVVGLAPGDFTGTITLTNIHGDGIQIKSNTKGAAFQLQLSRLRKLDQQSVSLGQYLDIRGDGFTGGAADSSTSIRFIGVFTPHGGAALQTTFDLVPTYRDGQQVTYVLEEKLGLGAAVDLRGPRGKLQGSWTPTLYWKGKTQQGLSATMGLDIAPVKQVVWVRFITGWTDGLKKFGLAAADSKIREQIIRVIRRDYAGINLEIRTGEPADFELYAKLDIGGPDPNGLGLLGYDNTHGKDVGNKRLYDWLGGVNALTQKDGYPGYGGIFLESMWGFSENPPAGVNKSPLHTPRFDKIFDPFRPGKGKALDVSEVAGIKKMMSMAECPAVTRSKQASCVVMVLGNVLGSTASHEVGHSLGLAAPYGAAHQFHNIGDLPNRLMESGKDRPFDERAELTGKGPAVFCLEEFNYLKKVLPLVPSNDPTVTRPPC